MLFLFSITCSLTSTILAALSANIGSGFSISYEPPKLADLELFDSQNKSFNAQPFGMLLQAISNDAYSSASNMTKVDELANAKTTAANMRGFAVSKESGSDITVELGGLKWTATYLSKDNEGNAILTLWLDESTQLSGKTYDTNKTFSSNGTSTWNSGFSPSDDTSVPYPSAMYGTSYMSAVVLNNGGGYITSQGAEELIQADQNLDSVFALFTMSDLGLTQYLVTPEHVLWQKEGQSTKALIDDLSYNSPNENWSNDVTDDGFYSSGYNYAHKTGNDEWKNDYLWLPSLSETGRNDSHNGIWATSQNQRKNAANSLLRSGSYNLANHANRLFTAGSDWAGSSVGSTGAVRPALHLNLTAIAKSLK